MANNFWKSSHCEQWILDKTDLIRERANDLKTLTEDEYHQIMIYFVNYIHSLADTCGIQNPHLNTRQQVLWTACVYFRRFYARRSLKDIDPFLLSHTCLYLARRVDEMPPINSRLFIAAVNAAGKNKPWFQQIPETENQNYMRLINEAEFYLLEILDCSLLVFNPYRDLDRIFQDMTEEERVREEGVRQEAWRLINDALRTDACLLYPPHQIAISALMGAVILLQRQEAFKPIFQNIATDYDDTIFDILKIIVGVYNLYAQVLDNDNCAENIAKLFVKIPKPVQLTAVGMM
uniref:Cyclin-like domain-containing protein n=1 Tax=Panagrolaimus sp. JU765 TaxID=591449 RepID=A0AC34RRN2_9BILA